MFADALYILRSCRVLYISSRDGPPFCPQGLNTDRGLSDMLCRHRRRRRKRRIDRGFGWRTANVWHVADICRKGHLGGRRRGVVGIRGRPLGMVWLLGWQLGKYQHDKHLTAKKKKKIEKHSHAYLQAICRVTLG
jgi:hypothetical protein